jgi:hypothetical protein
VQLEQLAEEKTEPFDLIFIDADKPNNPNYLKWALQFSKAGTVIISDNVIRNGEVIDYHSTDPRVHGIRKFMDMLSADSAIAGTAIQTVGSTGFISELCSRGHNGPYHTLNAIALSLRESGMKIPMFGRKRQKGCIPRMPNEGAALFIVFNMLITSSGHVPFWKRRPVP